MTDETRRLLAEIDALYEKATKGPWTLLHKNGVLEIDDAHPYKTGTAVVHWAGFDSSNKPPKEKLANAHLIVALVNAWPRLKELRSEGRGWRKVEWLEYARPTNTDSTIWRQDDSGNWWVFDIPPITAAPPAPNRDAEDARLLRELRRYFVRLKHRADVRGGPDVSAMSIADEATALIDAALAAAPEREGEA